VTIAAYRFFDNSTADWRAWSRINSKTEQRMAEQSVVLCLQEREVRELRKANEILRLASAFFAQAGLDRRFKP
jgi:hypothetical protein